MELGKSFEVRFIDKETNDVILKTQRTQAAISNNETIKIPRVFGIPNTKGNKELYDQLNGLIGGKYRLESDQVKGVFKVSKEGNEIVLTEVV